jgi:ribosomal protein L7/L12
MVSTDLKNFAVKVQTALRDNGVTVDVYQLLSIVDALYVEPIDNTLDGLLAKTKAGDWSRDLLVKVALLDDGREVTYYSGNTDTNTVAEYLRQTKKINAIKRLRGLTGAGLRESKEAVEDWRVSGPRPIRVGDTVKVLEAEFADSIIGKTGKVISVDNPSRNLYDADHPYRVQVGDSDVWDVARCERV